MKLFMLSLALLSAPFILSGCGEAATPTKTELTQALTNKLAGDHAKVEAKVNAMEPGLEHRSLSESLAMQRAQTLTVIKINDCLSNDDTNIQRCDVLLNISMKGLSGSQERNVVLHVSKSDDVWIMNKMSLPNSAT